MEIKAWVKLASFIENIVGYVEHPKKSTKKLQKWGDFSKASVYKIIHMCGSDNKESACNAGDWGSIPGLGRSPGEGHGDPLQYSGLENPHGQKSLMGYSPWGRKESGITEWLKNNNGKPIDRKLWNSGCKLFLKRPDSKYYRLHGSHVVCHIISSQCALKLIKILTWSLVQWSYQSRQCVEFGPVVLVWAPSTKCCWKERRKT